MGKQHKTKCDDTITRSYHRFYHSKLTMSSTTAPSGVPINNGATTNTKTLKGKNALFMALVTGLALDAKKKKENKVKVDEREPAQVDPPLAKVTESSGDEIELEPVVDTESRVPPPSPSSQRRPIPPPPAAALVSSPRNIRTPSPGRYHNMLSINKLAKENPEHQIQAKAYREKAYIGPARKIVTGTANHENGPSSISITEANCKIPKESPIRIKCDDAFFAELKHRAALQNTTKSLLTDNKETVASVEFLSNNNDDVSALDSKSFESEKPSTTIMESLECTTPPTQAEKSKPVDLPVKYLDVLPDDEKKDIVIMNMKKYRSPLPFDEDGESEDIEDEVEATAKEVENISNIADKLPMARRNECKTKETKKSDNTQVLGALAHTRKGQVKEPVKPRTDSAAAPTTDINLIATIVSAKRIKNVDDIEEARSFKSLPAKFASRSQVKSRGLDTVFESEGKDEVDQTVKHGNGPFQFGTKKVEQKTDDYFDELTTTSMSIKEITISSNDDKKGDRSTALASISSKIEHQTRKLAELEAEALRKHKEAEIAAIDAREALEKMLEAKSNDEAQRAYFRKEPEASRLKSSFMNEREVKSKKDLVKDDQTIFSSCSTWSEDSDHKRTKTAFSSKKKTTSDFDYESVLSSSKDGQTSACLYSDASSSQYSKSFDNEVEMGSHYKDISKPECVNRSHTPSYQDDLKTDAIRKKHDKKTTPQILRNRRSSTRGRNRDLNTHSTQRSQPVSASHAKAIENDKGLLLPSLMSPDPPSIQGKQSRRQGDFRARHRSRSQSRDKTLLAKHDMAMSPTKSSKKPNNLSRHSPRHGTNDVLDTTKVSTSLHGVSPESRQPVLSRSQPEAVHDSDHMLRNGIPIPSFGNHGSPPIISLTGYTNRDSAHLSQPQIGTWAQTSQLPYNQPYQLIPNSVPSAPISLTDYTNRTQNFSMKPTVENMGHYTTESFGVPSTFYQSMGMQTPQQSSTCTIRPYSTGYMDHGHHTPYQSQQPYARFFNSTGGVRVNQYSMPSEGGDLS